MYWLTSITVNKKGRHVQRYKCIYNFIMASTCLYILGYYHRAAYNCITTLNIKIPQFPLKKYKLQTHIVAVTKTHKKSNCPATLSKILSRDLQ